MLATATDDDDEYGDELVYDSELDETLRAAERAVPDIEDVPTQALSPFDEFRRRGNLSVSDLVGTTWCEVQFDYRLRTLPFLPVSRRPTTITSTKGASIAVDQAKVEGKERILKRGETIHKRLEREIHPTEVMVAATTREDTMLNMFSALEALLTLGKCRELPVAGFVDDVYVVGIIDEITRVPIVESPTKGRQTRAKRAESGRQTSLSDFFGGKSLPQPPTHRLLVSDSKTRAAGSMPREEDTLAGRLQVMLYKELIDALLVPREATALPQEANVEAEGSELAIEVEAEPPDKPSEAYLPTCSQQDTGLWRIWGHLGLDTSAQFSDTFLAQSRPVVESNELRFGVSEGQTLAEYGKSWTRYVAALGLGTGPDECRTDTTLELVYRRAAPKRKKEAARKRRKGGKSKGKRRGKDRADAAATAMPPTLEGIDASTLDEETQLQLALQLSLQESQGGSAAAPQTLDEVLIDDDDHALVVAQSRVDSPVPFHGSEASHCEQPPSQPIGPAEEVGGDRAISEPPPAFSAGSGPANGVLGTVLSSQPCGPDSAVPSSALGIGLGRQTPSYSQRSASSQTKYFTSDSEQEREDAELAWAVEMSLGAGSQEAAAPSRVGVMSPPERKARTRSPSPSPTPAYAGTASGSIIGRHKFEHDPAALGTHLRSVLQYWRGTREPLGVSPAQVRRCHWCEFEDGCEWRQAKAAEALERYRSQRMF